MTSRRLRFLFLLGLPFSPLYDLAMRLRARLYHHGLLRRHKMAVPVISVGNLTMGGTGKTPLVIYIARLLEAMGLKPAILSRGYGRQSIRGEEGRVVVVADGSPGGELLAGPERAGDEPVLLARSLPGVPVLVAKRRVLSSRHAVDQLGANSLLLDDGFQHLALARDLDLVLFSARDLPLGARVFPGGPLREPWSALERADALVITGVDDGNREQVGRFRHFLQELLPGTPSFIGEYLPVCLLDGHSGKGMALDKGRGKPWFGFAGIAQPGSFQETLQRANFLVTGFRSFADHHPYTAADMAELIAAARQRRAGGLITTEKDLVKLQPLAGDYPLLALRVALFMEESFDEFLRRRLLAYCGQ
ncbi:tetraacyldisaccharide 4'-kinase [Desulfurivibrio sp. D14AmB]|uniref:tetraacyldisaccharide 4'-kinase n=1 Tax=Desulfurivibrio sp. D14AmB TaxID=3374370 RepID=UPI00376F16DF